MLEKGGPDLAEKFFQPLMEANSKWGNEDALDRIFMTMHKIGAPDAELKEALIKFHHNLKKSLLVLPVLEHSHCDVEHIQSVIEAVKDLYL